MTTEPMIPVNATFWLHSMIEVPEELWRRYGGNPDNDDALYAIDGLAVEAMEAIIEHKGLHYLVHSAEYRAAEPIEHLRTVVQYADEHIADRHEFLESVAAAALEAVGYDIETIPEPDHP